MINLFPKFRSITKKMKTFRLIAATFVFAAIFAVSAFAQAPAAGKIGVINTQAFDVDKGGITKYITAMNTLENEFKPVQTDLQTVATKIQSLQKEIETLQKQAATGGVPVDPKSAQAKVEQFQSLQIEFKRKQEDAKVKFEKREVTVMGPIRQDIGNAIQEFAKKNGYTMIFDISKDQTGLLLMLDEKADVTREFITFYNARPAGSATK